MCLLLKCAVRYVFISSVTECCYDGYEIMRFVELISVIRVLRFITLILGVFGFLAWLWLWL